MIQNKIKFSFSKQSKFKLVQLIKLMCTVKPLLMDTTQKRTHSQYWTRVTLNSIVYVLHGLMYTSNDSINSLNW